ncbi:MAG: cytidylate kinase [Planctomycetes bacterium HGW-Planctomycetes-1]|nr:MAG: cytidylate kinase [Planctomycetes bacterium HGW-Planctomycetes-1]
MAKLLITIDGPAGSGKSSAAKLLAAKLTAAFLDTGAMYRAAALAAMRTSCDLNDVTKLEEIIDKTDFKFEIEAGQMTVKINGGDATEQIRDPQVTANVHFVASEPSLRQRIVRLQRAFAGRYEKIVAEGRDQGTVVFPDADFKFFLTADAQERSKRRAKELTEKGYKVDLDKLQQEIEKRDRQDSTRKISPLIAAADAITVNTTNLTLEQVVEKIFGLIKNND